MCLNFVTRLREDLLPAYQSIKIHPEFEEWFVQYRDHPSYYCNFHIYTYLGHSLLVKFTNSTCVKSFMSPQAWKVVNTHAHEISEWIIISRLIYSQAPHLWEINVDVQSDLATLAFNNREQIEDFCIRILILQH